MAMSVRRMLGLAGDRRSCTLMILQTTPSGAFGLNESLVLEQVLTQ